MVDLRFWAMRRPDNIGRMPMPQEEVDRSVPARWGLLRRGER